MSQVSYGTITITDIPSSSSTKQHFWFNSTQQGALLAGAYITDTDIDTFKSGKSGGYLLARSDGLILGKASNRYMELEGSELKFYKSGTTDSTATIATNVAAKLNSTGLEIANGGIKAGTPGQNGFVYLSSEDYPKGTSGITINSHTPDVNDPAWREIIGTKFGVDSEGNLYANNADISGKIVATEGVIGGCVIDSEGHLNVPSAYIDGTLTVTTIEGGTFNTNDYIHLSLEDSQAISIGNSGSKTDWRIIAGNAFGVDKAGNLYSTSANISGLITAIGGSIGAWSVESPSNGTYTYGGALYTGTFGSSGGIYLTPGYTTVTNIGGSTGSSNKTWVITAGDGFGVTSDGTLYANLARITGDVKANTGTIGGAEGWTIESQKMSSGTIGSNNSMILSTTNLSGSIAGVTISDSEMASKGWRLTVGSNFGVDSAGDLYANDVHISGDIYSISGSTGGFAIDSTSIHTTSMNITSNASNSVGLSSSTFTRTINGTSCSDLKFAIGSKFAVANDGTLYANGANITNISADNITSGTIRADCIDASSITLSQIVGSGTSARMNNTGLYIYNQNTTYPTYLNIYTDNNMLSYIKGGVSTNNYGYGGLILFNNSSTEDLSAAVGIAESLTALNTYSHYERLLSITVREGLRLLDAGRTLFSVSTQGRTTINANDYTSDQAFVGVSINQVDKIRMGVGSGGSNHGLYSDIESRWIIYVNSSGETVIPGFSGGSSSGVTSITTSLGRHSTKSSSTGRVSFNVPGGTNDINKNDSAGNGNGIDFYNVSSGNGRGATMAYVQSKTDSDLRLKENIEELDYINFKNFYENLQPKQFIFKDCLVEEEELKRKRYGFIAQDIEMLIEQYGIGEGLVYSLDAVEGTPKAELTNGKVKNLDYNGLHALHVLYIKYLEERIANLENKVYSV